MTIRIDSITSRLTDHGHQWTLRAKGLYGQGIYFDLETGLNGRGLYAVASDREIDLVPDKRRVITNTRFGQSTFELLSTDRFHAHAQCTAKDVVQRVAAALVMIGWGPEVIDDRDAISGRRTVSGTARDERTKLGIAE